jgi:hypothetical protein
MLLPVLCATALCAQEKVASLDEIKSPGDLNKAITALDTQPFDAYNHCDLAKFASLL